MDYEGRPETDEYGAFYAGYVGRVPGGGLVHRSVLEERATWRRSESGARRSGRAQARQAGFRASGELRPSAPPFFEVALSLPLAGGT